MDILISAQSVVREWKVVAMNDIISRQAAIEAVGEVHPLDYNAQSTINRIKKIPSAQEWIPCSERLPDDGQWVLVWGKWQENPIMMFRENDAWIDDQFEFYDTVTHWMPLPEPPKEE